MIPWKIKRINSTFFNKKIIQSIAEVASTLNLKGYGPNREKSIRKITIEKAVTIIGQSVTEVTHEERLEKYLWPP